MFASSTKASRMHRPPHWLLAPVLAAALLAGCSTLPSTRAPVSKDPSANQRETWSGRLGLLIYGADGMQTEQSFSGSFELQGSPAAGELHMFNPLGSQVAQLRWSATGAWLQQGNKVTPSGSLPELMQRILGTDIPVPALFAWLQGRSDSTPGWEIDLAQFAQGRIIAHRRHPAPQAQLRIVLQQP